MDSQNKEVLQISGVSFLGRKKIEEPSEEVCALRQECAERLRELGYTCRVNDPGNCWLQTPHDRGSFEVLLWKGKAPADDFLTYVRPESTRSNAEALPHVLARLKEILEKIAGGVKPVLETVES